MALTEYRKKSILSKVASYRPVHECAITTLVEHFVKLAESPIGPKLDAIAKPVKPPPVVKQPKPRPFPKAKRVQVIRQQPGTGGAAGILPKSTAPPPQPLPKWDFSQGWGGEGQIAKVKSNIAAVQGYGKQGGAGHKAAYAKALAWDPFTRKDGTKITMENLTQDDTQYLKKLPDGSFNPMFYKADGTRQSVKDRKGKDYMTLKRRPDAPLTDENIQFDEMLTREFYPSGKRNELYDPKGRFKHMKFSFKERDPTEKVPAHLRDIEFPKIPEGATISSIGRALKEKGVRRVEGGYSPMVSEWASKGTIGGSKVEGADHDMAKAFTALSADQKNSLFKANPELFDQLRRVASPYETTGEQKRPYEEKGQFAPDQGRADYGFAGPATTKDLAGNITNLEDPNIPKDFYEKSTVRYVDNKGVVRVKRPTFPTKVAKNPSALVAGKKPDTNAPTGEGKDMNLTATAGGAPGSPVPSSGTGKITDKNADGIEDDPGKTLDVAANDPTTPEGKKLTQQLDTSTPTGVPTPDDKPLFQGEQQVTAIQPDTLSSYPYRKDTGRRVGPWSNQIETGNRTYLADYGKVLQVAEKHPNLEIKLPTLKKGTKPTAETNLAAATHVAGQMTKMMRDRYGASSFVVEAKDVQYMMGITGKAGSNFDAGATLKFGPTDLLNYYQLKHWEGGAMALGPDSSSATAPTMSDKEREKRKKNFKGRFKGQLRGRRGYSTDT